MENNVKKPSNEIRYKFYTTEKQIPWLISTDIKPLPNITDNYFNFVELPSTKQFDFINPFQARMVVNKDTYTYWKVERYVNNVKDKTYYFYTKRIISYIKNGFIIEVELDTYLTYTRDVINSIIANKRPVKINRGSITTNMLFDNDKTYFNTFLKSLKTLDTNVFNADDTYKNTRPFRLSGLDNYNQSTTKYPYVFDGYINISKSTKPVNYLEDLIHISAFYPLRPRQNGYGSIQIKQGNNNVIQHAKEYVNYIDNNNSTWLISADERKQINDILKKYIVLQDIITIDSPDSIVDLNKNMINSYFAVFRNIDGSIDCYPIIGKMKGKFNSPVCTTYTYPNVQDSSNYNKASTTNVYKGRIYCNYDSSITATLKNDWESIYNDYVKNIPSYYTNKSYIGIFRGIIPTGRNNKKMFFLSDNSTTSEMDIFNNGKRIQYQHYIPTRMVLKLNYEDVANMEFINDTGIGFEKFKICTAGKELLDDYIKLLQPICIGTSEIVPARYSFLGEKGEGKIEFSINMVLSFLDGFYLFLKSDLYNNASYAIGLGNTLPTKTEAYQQQLDIINQQKNAGVYSGIGNLIARPLNWFTGSFGSGLSASGLVRENTIHSSNIINDYSAGYGVSDDLIKDAPIFSASYGKSFSRGFSGSISGIGGFIGDSISLWNTVKQAEIARKNIGLGYLTSTTDDMLSAVVHNFVASNENNPTYIDSTFNTVAYIKEFDKATIDKYKNYYTMFGFNINEFLDSNYIHNVIQYATNSNSIGFFQLDRDWCLIYLNELTQSSKYNDMLVKDAIISDLTKGIRVKKYI